jgi:7,8-dihydroneopterin aldolase/epimerase/oxygenase
VPSARIRIHDLETWCQIGVPDTERANPQRLLVDLEFDTSHPQADDIAATVDYATVADTARTTAQARPRHLIETLASDILHAVLDRFPISNLIVRVRKFSVPTVREVSVEVCQPPDRT